MNGTKNHGKVFVMTKSYKSIGYMKVSDAIKLTSCDALELNLAISESKDIFETEEYYVSIDTRS
jgi:hypothetical protein